jgi:tetratricopeptide (TPR) repeat protein
LEGESGQELSTADKRAKALVYVRRGGIADQQEAIRLMEDAISDPHGTLPEDHLILASLYENDGRSHRAREELLFLVVQNNPTPKHLGEYVRFLLKHGNTSEATAWLAQLEAIDPHSFPTVTLRVQWLAQSDRREEIETLVEKYLAVRRESTDGARAEAQAMVDVAGLYASVGEEESAEKWYAKAREARPDSYREMAYWLLEQGRVSESIRVCLESARHDDSFRPAMVAATVLVRSGASEDNCRAAEPLISESVKRFSDEPDLLFTIATLRLIQQRNDEAIGLFRRVLHLDPEHLLAMNNLAMLLAEQPRSQTEALEIIDRAIGLAGPKVELHDTKAIVLMRLNRVDEAIDLLKGITGRDEWRSAPCVGNRQGRRSRIDGPHAGRTPPVVPVVVAYGMILQRK